MVMVVPERDIKCCTSCRHYRPADQWEGRCLLHFGATTCSDRCEEWEDGDA